MEEGRELTAVVERHLDERFVERVLAAAAEAPAGEVVRATVEVAVEMAESDPEGAREVLWQLRGDPVTLARLEVCLELSPERATLALGAAIQLASAELASAEPDLGSRVPELMRWLNGAW